MRTRRRLLREPECRRPGGLRGAEPPVPYLQCCLCEKPLGCLQSMLRLYLSDHLWRRVRVRDLFGMWLYIYAKKIQKRKYKKVVYSYDTTKLFPVLWSWVLGLGVLELRTPYNFWLIHQCCAVDRACVSRRNHVSELFFDGAKYWVAHFDVKVWVLENVSFH